MRIAICTLGCKVNQYETQAIEQELLRRGHTLTDFEEIADAYIVNTCSVTAVSDKKSRQMLRRACASASFPTYTFPIRARAPTACSAPRSNGFAIRALTP